MVRLVPSNNDIQTGTAVRSRLKQPLAARDSFFVHRSEAGVVLVLASASEGGFSVACPPAARLFNDTIAASLGPGPIQDELPYAVRNARQAFLERSKEWTTEEAAAEFGYPSVTYLVTHARAETVACSWLGNDKGRLYRGGKRIAETSPHDLGRTLREQGHDTRAHDTALMSVCTRQFGLGHAAAEEEHRGWTVSESDVLIVTDVFADRGLSEEVLAREAAAAGSAQSLADRLADLAFSDATSAVRVGVVRWV